MPLTENDAFYVSIIQIVPSEMILDLVGQLYGDTTTRRTNRYRGIGCV